MMHQHHLIPILAFTVIFLLAIAAPCQRSCGDMEVPYPFGLLQDGPDCYFNESYRVDCYKNSTDTVPYWVNRADDFSIYSISLVNHELRIPMFVSRDCYSDTGVSSYNNDPFIKMPEFPVSNTKNKFIAIGCDTYAVFSKVKGFSYGEDYKTGCLTTCTDLIGVVNAKGSCSGIGCCFSTIPKNAYSFGITVSSYNNHSGVKGFNKCSYAFVVANDSFHFSADYLSNFNNETVPIVLDWSVGEGTCEEAKMNKTSYMCKENSDCSDIENGRGYQCRCMNGYQGNPYLSGDAGCQDIDECETTRPCVENAKCVNMLGNFTCSCQKGHDGDGRTNGTGCKSFEGKELQTIIISLGVSMGISFLLLLCSWSYWGLRKRRIIKQKEKFFQQNGGLVLQKFIAEHNGSVESTRIFTSKELEKATNNYHESNILGQGGQGTVYKGELNNKVVAIKRSKIIDQTQVKDFINELMILTQINHKNVVKLIGCCLETEVPLLVYEFITNGTLFDYIHKVGNHVHMSWKSCLRIAVETAGALAYLHEDATTQVIHRDIKTANILLDDNYTAKVSDFGASRFVPLDQKQVATLVQGTLGYLDPEYFYEMKLTEKSDVYSFGVVLAELLTGLHALSFARPEKERNLSTYFVSKYKEGNLFDIIDKRIFDGMYAEEIKDVAMIAIRCLQTRREERPSMKEVSMELVGLVRATERHSKLDNNHGETQNLLIQEVTQYNDTNGSNSMPYDSLKNELGFQIAHGR